MTKRFQRFPKIITACLSVATVASLAACGSIPEPKKSDLSQTSVVTLTQEEKIRSRVIKDVVSADANQDVDALAKYAEGPELAVRTAQLTIAKATKKLDPAATIPTGYQQLVGPGPSTPSPARPKTGRRPGSWFSPRTRPAPTTSSGAWSACFPA